MKEYDQKNNASVLEGELTDLVIYYGGDNFDGTAGTDLQTARALTKYSPVLYVEPIISGRKWISRLRWDLQPGLQIINSRMARLTVVGIPGMTRALLHRLVAPLMAYRTRGALQKIYGQAPKRDKPVRVVISSQVEIDWCAIPAQKRLFYCTDDMSSGAVLWGLPVERLALAERAMLHKVDVIAVVSPLLVDRYARLGVRAHLVPNGCDPEAYLCVDTATLPSDIQFASPIAGFIGNINDRIDFGLLEAVADEGCLLLLVGPKAKKWASEGRFQALISRRNVCWVGPKQFTDLPSYLRVITVGLTPYKDNDFNRASFPLKTLEYLAAGRAVVATPLPVYEWLNTSLITIASGPKEFAAAVRAELDRHYTTELAEQRRRFAHSHSWSRRADLIAELVDLLPFNESD